MIYPEIDELTRPFWEAARNHRLVVQRCRRCQACWFPPLPRCPECHGAEVDWQPVSGKGTVYSTTDVTHSVHRVTDDWVPYRICLVDLDEGPRLVSNCRSQPQAAGLVPGARVEVFFEELAPDLVLPQFRVARTAGA